MTNCDWDNPTELLDDNDIWLDENEIAIMKTDDSAWDSTYIYHVNTDPEILFTTKNLCI